MKLIRWIAFPIVFLIGITIVHFVSFLVAASAATWLSVIVHILFGAVLGVAGFGAVATAPQRKVAAWIAFALLVLNEIIAFGGAESNQWSGSVITGRLIVDFYLVIGMLQASALKSEGASAEA